METIFLYAPAPAHTRDHHPESHGRLDGLLPFLRGQGVLDHLLRADGRPAETQQLARVHTSALIDKVRLASERGRPALDADTYTTAESYTLARQAAGACCVAVERIVGGAARNGLAVVRPPGHHSGRDTVGGFCLFNNVAVAARHAQQALGVERILIVDFDVHHGNGTQDIFYDDDSVLFISLHLRYPFFYPGTGALDETGHGAGEGLTVNVPFPPLVGDSGYERAFSEIVVPRARHFAPQLILVSTGFDAHWQDPLARAGLSLQGYADSCRLLVALADELCEGRVLFVLEGGYNRQVLRFGLLNLVRVLLGQEEFLDPVGPLPDSETDVTNLLADLRQRHLLN